MFSQAQLSATDNIKGVDVNMKSRRLVYAIIIGTLLAGAVFGVLKNRHSPSAGQETDLDEPSIDDEVKDAASGDEEAIDPDVADDMDDSFDELLEDILAEAEERMDDIAKEGEEIKARLSAGAQTPQAKSMLERTIDDHRRKIEELEQEFEAASDERETRNALSAIGSEYSFMYRKTPPRLTSLRREYIYESVKAFEESTDMGSATSAFYLISSLDQYQKEGFGNLPLSGRVIDAELELEYCFLAYDCLVAYEEEYPGVPHRPWLVKGIANGIKRTLDESDRTEELQQIKIDLLSKYEGTALGKQIKALFVQDISRRRRLKQKYKSGGE